MSDRSPNGRGDRAALHLAFYTDATAMGGAEQALGTLVANLSAVHRVTVVGIDAELVAALTGRRTGAAAIVLPPVRDKRDLAPIVAHLRCFRRLRADVLQLNLRHSYSCQYAGLAGMLAPRTRVVAVEHFPSPPTAQLQLVLKRLSSRRLAAHVAVSDSAARAVEGLLGYPRGGVRTLYSGVDDVSGSAAAERPTGSVVGAVGRLSIEKGFDVLIEAVALLDGVTCVLVGDGPERPALEERARALGVSDRIDFRGWQADARSLIASFDVLVVPSRLESFGLAALEGMVAGLPVVASRIGGLPEIVDDGLTGLLVAPDDPGALAGAIERALMPEVGRPMGESGRARALCAFPIDKMVKSFEDLYEEVAQ